MVWRLYSTNSGAVIHRHDITMTLFANANYIVYWRFWECLVCRVTMCQVISNSGISHIKLSRYYIRVYLFVCISIYHNSPDKRGFKSGYHTNSLPWHASQFVSIHFTWQKFFTAGNNQSYGTQLILGYKNFDSTELEVGCVALSPDGIWLSRNCDETKHFICAIENLR